MEPIRRVALLAAVLLFSPVACGPQLEAEQEDPTDVTSARLTEASGQVSYHLDAYTFRRVPLSGSVYTYDWLTLCTNTGAQYTMNVYRGDGTFIAQRHALYQAEWAGGANNHYVTVSAGSTGRNCTTFWR